MCVLLCNVMICIIDISCNGSTEFTEFCTVDFPPCEITVSVDVEFITRVSFSLTIDRSSLQSGVTRGQHASSRVIFDGN